MNHLLIQDSVNFVSEKTKNLSTYGQIMNSSEFQEEKDFKNGDIWDANASHISNIMEFESKGSMFDYDSEVDIDKNDNQQDGRQDNSKVIDSQEIANLMAKFMFPQ